MPLSDYVNFNPAPEATGGYGYGSSIEDLMRMNVPFDFNMAANLPQSYVEQDISSPFEQYQQYVQSQQPGNVSTIQTMGGPDVSGVYVNPAVAGIIGQSNISATGEAPSLFPSNIFSGPVPSLGFGNITGAALNALYNTGTAGFNYLNNLGVNQVALGNLPAGNISFGEQSTTYPSLAGANVSTTYAPGVGQSAANQNAENALFSQTIGTPNWWPSYGAVAGSATATPQAAATPAQASFVGQIDPGVVGLDPYLVNATRFTGGPASLGGTANLGTGTNSLDFGMGYGGGGAAPIVLDPFQVQGGGGLPQVSLIPSLQPSVGLVTLAPVEVTAPPFSSGPSSLGSISSLQNRPIDFSNISGSGMGPYASQTPVTLPPFVVTPAPTVTPTTTLISQTVTVTSTVERPVTLPPFVVTDQPTPTPSTTILSPTVSVTNIFDTPVVMSPVVVTPSSTVTISTTVVSPTVSVTNIFDTPVVLPPVVVTPSATITPSISVVSPTLSVTSTITVTPPPSPSINVTPTPSATPSPTPLVTPPVTPFSSEPTIPAQPGTPASLTNIFSMPTDRNFARELEASRKALADQQANLMGMYGGIYQNLLGQTAIPQAAQQSLAQMQADAAKLQRIQGGQLAAEDIRNAQQGAREAYAARGQVMGPGAVSAEILNREAIRQQRENEARAAYQASMGNVFNAAQLQTGNIFSPIGNLVQGTFNPLGAYPQDVYSSNYNAALAQQIAAMNNQAAIEAAKYGAQASKQAATTSGLFNIGAQAASSPSFWNWLTGKG